MSPPPASSPPFVPSRPESLLPTPSRVRASITSGVLLGLGLWPNGVVAGIPWTTGVLAWIAFVPLLPSVADASSIRAVAIDVFLAYLVAAVLAFGWVLAHPFWWTALASLGGLLTWAVTMTIPWLLAKSLSRLRPSWPLPPFLILIVPPLQNWALTDGWDFPWGLLAQTQVGVRGVEWGVVLLGPSLAGLLLLAWNVALERVWKHWSNWMPGAQRHPTRPGHIGLSAVLVLVLSVLLATGGDRTIPASAPPPDESAETASSVSVLVVQPATPPEVWADVDDVKRIHRLLAITDVNLQATSAPVDLVLWPETALPPSVVSGTPTFDSLRTWARGRSVSLLTGGIARASSDAGGNSGANDGMDAGSRLFVNRAWLFPATGGPVQAYDKRALVPFAERVPGSSLLPSLSALSVPAGGVEHYARGRRPPVLSVPLGITAPDVPPRDTLRVGVRICGESVFPSPPSDARTIDLWVTLAQTGWWGDVPAPQQHVAFSRLLPRRTGRAMVIASVRGPSVVLGPGGEKQTLVPVGQRAARHVVLSVPSSPGNDSSP